MAADSDHHKVAEHALAMLKVLYLHEGPYAVVESAKHMVVAAAAVISQELGPAEAQRFLHVVGDPQSDDTLDELVFLLVRGLTAAFILTQDFHCELHQLPAF